MSNMLPSRSIAECAARIALRRRSAKLHATSKSRKSALEVLIVAIRQRQHTPGQRRNVYRYSSTWPVSRLSGEVIGTLKRCSQKANPGSPAKSRVVFSDTWREQPIQPDTDYRS